MSKRSLRCCDDLMLQPSLFYLWQRQLFENADKAFTDAKEATSPSSREKQLEAKLAALEAKLARKDSVIAEIS